MAGYNPFLLNRQSSFRFESLFETASSPFLALRRQTSAMGNATPRSDDNVVSSQSGFGPHGFNPNESLPYATPRSGLGSFDMFGGLKLNIEREHNVLNEIHRDSA